MAQEPSGDDLVEVGEDERFAVGEQDLGDSRGWGGLRDLLDPVHAQGASRRLW
jgi:hypothetical protein